jgi:phosphinothricin acetyltransferase
MEIYSMRFRTRTLIALAGIAQPNVASNGLHERFGFKSNGIFSQVGRKFGRFWDGMWMDRPLKLP